MECPDPHVPAQPPQQLRQPFLHLTGRLIRERDRHYMPGRDVQRAYQVGDTVRQHARLAAAGTGQHEYRAALGLDRFTTPGDRPFRVHDTPLGRIGLHTCYDARFPESARVLALLGADLIVLPTNWPAGAEPIAEHATITRAVENHVYYMAVDRVGEERGFRFIGLSRIVDPLGRTLAAGGASGEEILFAEIEPARARAKRVVRDGGEYVVDPMGHRRPDLYGNLGTDPISGTDPVS